MEKVEAWVLLLAQGTLGMVVVLLSKQAILQGQVTEVQLQYRLAMLLMQVAIMEDLYQSQQGLQKDLRVLIMVVILIFEVGMLLRASEVVFPLSRDTALALGVAH